MQSFLRISGYTYVMTLLFFASCSKNAASAPANGSSTDSVTAALTSGNWIISSFVQQKEDNTPSFTGYVFTFAADGQLIATKNGAAVHGTWHYSPAVTYYGSSSTAAIVINTGTDNPFRRLSKTWNLSSSAATAIKLDNPEIQEDEHLQFQKQ